MMLLSKSSTTDFSGCYFFIELGMKRSNMKCLRKYKWVKLHRWCLPEGNGIMKSWAKLASRAAFRKGFGMYCGHRNPVTPGMWSGGVVGLKSILGVRRRSQALCIMHELESLGYIKFSHV